MRKPKPIVLSAEEEKILKRWSASRKTPHRLVIRARIILMAAQGKQNTTIAKELNVSRPTVQLWRERFLDARVAGIEKDATRPGRKPTLSALKERAIVEATLKSTPKDATHWSTRSMAKAQKVSRMSVQRIWAKHNLKPHLVETFKLSRDPNFYDKLQDIVGLYLNPPEKALVLCVDEKSQIQALNRTEPMLPLAKGVPAKQTHDYKRNGTTTLFAALNALEGKVIGECMNRHRHQEFIRFLNRIDRETPPELDLHLIIDNYATHKHAKVKSWLKRHRRFHFHYTPTSSSWLNLVERWFRDLTQKRIRRGSFSHVKELVGIIDDYIKYNNNEPKPFIWTASAESIMEKIVKCKKALGTLH